MDVIPFLWLCLFLREHILRKQQQQNKTSPQQCDIFWCFEEQNHITIVPLCFCSWEHLSVATCSVELLSAMYDYLHLQNATRKWCHPQNTSDWSTFSMTGSSLYKILPTGAAQLNNRFFSDHINSKIKKSYKSLFAQQRQNLTISFNECSFCILHSLPRDMHTHGEKHKCLRRDVCFGTFTVCLRGERIPSSPWPGVTKKERGGTQTEREGREEIRHSFEVTRPVGGTFVSPWWQRGEPNILIPHFPFRSTLNKIINRKNKGRGSEWDRSWRWVGACVSGLIFTFTCESLLWGRGRRKAKSHFHHRWSRFYSKWLFLWRTQQHMKAFLLKILNLHRLILLLTCVFLPSSSNNSGVFAFIFLSRGNNTHWGELHLLEAIFVLSMGGYLVHPVAILITSGEASVQHVCLSFKLLFSCGWLYYEIFRVWMNIGNVNNLTCVYSLDEGQIT